MKTWFGGAAAVTFALTISLTMPGVATAAPKDGCPSGQSDWQRGTVDEIAAIVWDGLVDQSPRPGGVGDFADYIDAAVNRNGDVYLCLTTRWGDRPAEQAHWYGVPLFIMVDNNARG